MPRLYFKVKTEICPKCGAVREVVVQGLFHQKRRMENPLGIIGFKCDNCGDFKYAESLYKVKVGD